MGSREDDDDASYIVKDKAGSVWMNILHCGKTRHSERTSERGEGGKAESIMLSR